MTPLTLRALRDLMFLTAEDAAHLLAASGARPGGVQPRSWMAWERGEKPIPPDVVSNVRAAWSARQQLVERMRRQIDADDVQLGSARTVPLVYYPRATQWEGPALKWRLHCSALAELAATDDRVELVGPE